MEALGRACQLVDKYIKHLTVVGKERYDMVEKLNLQLISTIECYSTIRKKQNKQFMNLNAVEQYKQCINCYSRLISEAQQTNKQIDNLKKRFEQTKLCKETVDKHSKEVLNMFGQYNDVSL